MPDPQPSLATAEMSNARMNHGIRIGSRPFFMSVIFSS